MKLYLAPEPSINLMRYLRSTSGEDGLPGFPMRKRLLSDAINTVRAMNELDPIAQRWLDQAGFPVHAFVGERTKGTSTNQLVTHVFSGPVPYGAFHDIGHDIRICAPHFALMLMCSHIDLVDAVALGMELCGSYSHWRIAPDVFGDPYYLEYSETQACTFDLPAVLKVQRAKEFVGRQAGLRGAVGARAALRWIVDNSASSMETAIYMLLCLPKRLGGYGLPKPTLNPKLVISNPDGLKERYPDLFWQDANIDVEYNSDSAHSGEWSRYRDSKREVELAVANVKVLPLTRSQVMNVDDFDAFAQGLRRMLGIRARAADSDWVFRRADLRRKLLSNWK